MKIGFIKHLVGIKAERGMDTIIQTLVAFDPEGATEAQLREMEEELDKLGLKVAESHTAAEREQREADEIQKLQAQRFAALDSLEKQRAASTDESAKASLTASMENLTALLEAMSPDIEREVSEAKTAKEFLAELQDAYRDAGTKLKGARAKLNAARTSMQQSELVRQRAEDHADAAAVAAGLRHTTNSLDTALNAMQTLATQNQEAAQAATAKAQLLKPTDVEKDDPNIAEAMQTGPVEALSLDERMGKLRGSLQK